MQDYKKKIEGDLHDLCKDILDLIDSHLIKNSQGDEAVVFFYKMKGDYHRYIAEFASGSIHE